MVKVNNVDHIDIVVQDLEGYAKLLEGLGFKVISRTAHRGGAVEMQLPGPNQTILEFHQQQEGMALGVAHIAIGVDDVRAFYQEWSKKGIEFDREPHEVKVTGRVLTNIKDMGGCTIQVSDSRREAPES